MGINSNTIESGCAARGENQPVCEEIRRFGLPFPPALSPSQDQKPKNLITDSWVDALYDYTCGHRIE
jgi:hypothetical protein